MMICVSPLPPRALCPTPWSSPVPAQTPSADPSHNALTVIVSPPPNLFSLTLARSLDCSLLLPRSSGLHGDAIHRHDSVLGVRAAAEPGLLPTLRGSRPFLRPVPRLHRRRADGGVRGVSARGRSAARRL